MKKNKMFYNMFGEKPSMMVGGFWGPFESDPNYEKEAKKDGVKPCDFLTDYYFRKLKAAGINTLYATGRYYGESGFHKTFELAEKYGMKCFALEHRLYELSGSSDASKITESEVSGILDKIMTEQSCAGVYLQDEPNPAQHAAIARISEIFYNKYPEGKLIGNTIGAFLGERPGFNTTFYREMQSYVEKISPRYLCFDLYFWDEAKGELWVSFKVLSTIRQIADEYGTELVGMMQSGGKWTEYAFKNAPSPYPDEGMFNFNLNVFLAYGIKGIMYFPLFQPLEYTSKFSEEGERIYDISGLFGADGRENVWYGYAVKANRHIRACEDILLFCKFNGIISSGDKANVNLANQKEYINSGRYREVVGLEGDIMAGCLEYKKRTVLYVVNFLFDKESCAVIELDGMHEVSIIRNGKKEKIKSKRLEFNLTAGEGVLIEILC